MKIGTQIADPSEKTEYFAYYTTPVQGWIEALLARLHNWQPERRHRQQQNVKVVDTTFAGLHTYSVFTLFAV